MGMWRDDDVDATVGLLAVQRRANVARAVANIAAGLAANTIVGVGGMPIVESAVTERARALNLQRLRDDAAELQRRTTRATARTYAPHERPRAIIFIGATGVGKSFMARQRFPLGFWCAALTIACQPCAGFDSAAAAAAAATTTTLRAGSRRTRAAPAIGSTGTTATTRSSSTRRTMWSANAPRCRSAK